MESQQKYPKHYSFEFFPPRTDKGKTTIAKTLDELSKLKPAYMSCTYGAGGTTQVGTYDTVKLIVDRQQTAVPHITCIGSSKGVICNLLKTYTELGVKRVVALRGDLPQGQSDPGEFHYANELVTFIREEMGEDFGIEVACYPEVHPQAPSARADIENFKRKVGAGANCAITQYFFNIDAYFRFVDECEQSDIHIPIVPGIMPITNYTQLAKFSDLCGAEIPRWIRKRLEDYGDDLESIRAFGLDVVSELCRRLLDAGCPGLHFYTLNKHEPIVALWQRLGLKGPV
ncbi:MAG TPA: methylenetetrahydrofolate reductase [NAD(P)H] [Acidiferrobacteraceae bacterium]|nr:methylenetetrahydrofolate reductase [NAD(P)H] [Acidiferrobacteraceae bacterium]HEX20509.1 methylenetetrahydrofolate reductase [NAD(P)H] [Acidiferrobacteraceae bacterium]